MISGSSLGQPNSGFPICSRATPPICSRATPRPARNARAPSNLITQSSRPHCQPTQQATPRPQKSSPTRAQEYLLTTNTNSYSDSPTIAEPSQNSTKKNQDLECDLRSRRDSRSGNAICDLGRNAIRDLEADNAIRDTRYDRSPWKP